jgi:hypothetical protein
MLYSGADLIRTASSARFERMRSSTSVAAVAAPEQNGLLMDQDTRSALERFARFVHKEQKPKVKRLGLPVTYDQQIQLFQDHQGPGALLDIYI